MKMGKKVREYKSGDFIFAKVKGYPAWPARVQRLNGKKYFVYFYGTGETANLPPNMIFDYAENKDKFLTKTVKRKDFNLGVKQIEHDFANNVPVEEVVGTALLQDTSVNDTINESAANETMDESAVTDDDTTAVNETTEDTSTSQNDTGVDDSDETGGLVIDEGKKGRKSTKAATPAKPVKEPKTPRGKAKKEEQKEEVEEKKEEEIISRSGRKIRPKRYLDEHTEENTTLPSPAPKKRRGPSPAPEKEKESEKEKPKPDAVKTKTEKTKLFNTVSQSELEDLKEPFAQEDADKENILIAYLGSGQYVGIRLFQSRPTSFKNEAGRLQWDKQAAANALDLKMQLERGQIQPQSVMGQLVTDLHLTDEEKTTLDKERETEEKKSRVQFLKTEMKVVDLNAKIKTCLCLEKADTELCLKLLDELMELDLKALMLLKHPSCLETVKRMRAYVGNTNSWDLSESAALHFNKQAQRIRKQADLLYKNMKKLFATPAGLSFFEFFSERVLEFQKVTAKLTSDELLEMVNEPIELSAPSQLTLKTPATKDDEAAPATEDDNIKKINNNTPTKPKKTNGTQAKPPLKRQSSRKQQQEEKETTEKETTEKEQEDKEEIPAGKTNDKPEESKDTNTEENIAEEKEPESVTEEKEKTETTEIDKEQTESTEIEKETDTNEKSPSPVKECEKSPKNDEEKPQKKTEEKVEVKEKEKVEVKEKEKEKPDFDEPRAKRTRESRKTEPPSPRSPSKRKQKL